jgi:hypothetical protein
MEGLKHVPIASPSAESWLHIRTPLRWRTTALSERTMCRKLGLREWMLSEGR